MSKSDKQNTNQHDAPVATPAADLGELWQTLDVLPEAETPEDLLATTIEMIAVDGKHHRSGRSNWFSQIPADLWQWFAPAIAVGVSIVLGYFVGQSVPLAQQEPVDWRARRQEVLKNTLQEAIENNPSGAKKFFQEQFRNTQNAQERPLSSQQNKKKGSRAADTNASIPKNPRPVPLEGQERNRPPRGKQLGPLKGPGDQRRKQSAGAPLEESSP